jgi:hypothetical protein
LGLELRVISLASPVLKPLYLDLAIPLASQGLQHAASLLRNLIIVTT